jgi:hypothetical protein
MAPQASQPPQSFSLNDLLRQHCRDRLYIQPLHWTAQHLQLLECRFFNRQCTPQPASSTLAGLTPPSESEQSREDSKANKHPPKHGQDTDLECAVRRLAYDKSIMVKGWGLKHLLHALSNYRIITDLPYVLLYPFPITILQELAPNLSQRLSLPLLCRYISSQASLPRLRPCHQRYSNTFPRLRRLFRSCPLSRKLYPKAQMELPRPPPPKSHARPSTAYQY